MLALVHYSHLSRDLWTDEAFTVSYMAHPTIGALLEDVRKNEETPPAGFVGIWLWSHIFGQSEVAIRSASLIAGAGAVLGLAFASKPRLRPAEATVAVLIMAASPLFQHYLVEARGYALTVLLTLICIWTFERLYEQPESRQAQLFYAMSVTALFLTSYFSIAILAAQWLIALTLLRSPATRRARLWGWIFVQLFVAVWVILWLPALHYQLQVAPAATANWSSGPKDFFFMALGTLMGDPPLGWQFISWLTAAAASVSLILAAALSRRETGALLLRALALPAAILCLMTLLMQVVAVRYLIVLLPGAAMAVGVGFSTLRQRKPWLAWLLLMLLAGGMLIARVGLSATDLSGGWARLSERVAASADPKGDLVLFHPPWDQRIFEYYYHGPQLPMAGAHNYDDFYYSQGYSLRKTWTVSEATPVIAGHRRVWVFYDQLHHQVPPLALPYQQIGHWSEGRLELFLYAVPTP